MKKILLFNIMIFSVLLLNYDLMAQTLTVSPSNRSVTNASGNTTFTITSNVSWSVSDTATWLTVSPTSGNGNRTLTATYQANTTTSQRIGTITVTGSGITRTVTVTQAAGAAVLTVSPSNQSVTNTSGTTAFTITSNTSWSVSDTATWLSVSPTSGSNNATLTATYQANTTTSQRIGTITITGSGITRTVTVTQAAAPFTLTISPSNQSVTNISGTTAFTITSNTSWSVSDNATWLTVSPTSGSNNATLTATYQENTITSERIGTITVTGSGITRTVTVTQAAAPFTLTISPSNQSVTNISGTTAFTITSNTSWSVSDNATWLTVSPKSGSNNATLTATYQENTNTSERVGTITVTGGGITRTVTVTQESAPLLTVTPSDRFVGYTEGNTTFTITSNRNWSVEDNAEWVTVTPTSGSNDGTITVTYQENTNTSERVGTITVTGGGITQTVTVTQESAPLLTVTPSEMYVGYTEGETTFTIVSNRNWSVSDDAEWVTVTPASGSNDGTLAVTYQENTNTIERIGTITVTGGGITRTVTVTQSAAPFTLTVSPSNQSATNASGSTAFTVTSNTNWTVSDDEDWLTVNPTSGNNNQTITATYTENTTTAQRVGTITVTGGDITRTVTVTQSAAPFTLIVNPSNQLVTNASGSTAFTVTSNTSWTVSDDAEWLILSFVSGTGNETLTATYSENMSTVQRVGTITVTGDGITKIVTITQSGSNIALNYRYSFGDANSTNSYQIIGLPGANNLSISSLMIGLPGKEGDWRAFWDSGTSPLVEYNGNDHFYFTPGRAFWVISKKSININQNVAPVPLSLVDSTFSIQIHKGWNLISNPFDKAIPWGSINIANGGNQQPIYFYQKNSYTNPLNFEPYKGYYFFYNGDLTTLKIPYYIENFLGKENSFNTKELEIILTSNSGFRTKISAGISEDSKNGLDILDIFSPPSLFCDISMTLFNNEIETDYKYLQKEFRPEIGEGQDFEVLVKNTSNKTLELIVKGLENFSEYEVYLLDKSLMKFYDLRILNNIAVKKNTSGKEYRLSIGTEEYIRQKKSSLIPSEYVLYQNYSNPFNPKTTIMFAVPQQSKISLNIYNILGELVVELINDQLYEAGYHEVIVDFGQYTSGIYLYKLQTSSLGRQPFVEIKKMIFLK